MMLYYCPWSAVHQISLVWPIFEWLCQAWRADPWKAFAVVLVTSVDC